MKIPGEMLAVASALGELSQSVVFVGGMVRGVLVSDPAVEGPRPTKDVDLVLEVSSTAAYGQLEEEIRLRGFRNDMSDDAPICRYVLRSAGAGGEDIPVDFMPLDPHVLLPSSAGPLRVIDAPHFVATKLESFASRGGGDFWHHDLEDVVVLVDGRPELVEEVSTASKDVREFIAGEIVTLLAQDAFLDALSGHLSPDPASQARLPILLARLEALTQVSEVSASSVELESPQAPMTEAERTAALSWRPMRSSNVAGFRYDPDSSVLTVEFHNRRVYEHGGVPRNVFEGFKRAASAGRYHHRWIRQAGYPTRRIK